MGDSSSGEFNIWAEEQKSGADSFKTDRSMADLQRSEGEKPYFEEQK